MSSLPSPPLPLDSRTTRNPLHLKVNRLLSTNLEDIGTRTALDTLGSLSSGGEDINLALKRGGLRKEVDKKLAEGSREFLDAFTEVNDKLSLLQSHLTSMHTSCDAISTQLSTAHIGTKYLLDHAEGLRVQRSTTALQQTLLHLFLTRFTLSPEELSALTGRVSGNTLPAKLFTAMDHLVRIREDCATLLTASSPSSEAEIEKEGKDLQKAGLDLMEYTKKYLEEGYEKIFKFLHNVVRNNFGNNSEVGVEIRLAVKRLGEGRGELLDEILFLLGSTRSNLILNSFLDALTRGGPSGLPRPIELHAHDPIRYIGDILAFLHQTLASEREFLESLFGISDDGRWVGSVRQFSSSEEDETRLRKVLDRCMEGCGRPLKIRVQQTIKSQEGSLMTYRIATLIHFYKVTIERTVGVDALMVTVLTEIMNHAYEAFYETLHAQGRSLLRFIQPPSAALSAPTALRESLSTLREILSVYSSSLLETPTQPSTQTFPTESLLSPSLSVSSFPSFVTYPAETLQTPTATQSKRETEFQPVLEAALDPAMKMCEMMSEMRQSDWDKDIFLINCWDNVVGVLELFGECVGGRREEVERMLEERVGSLVGEHYKHLLKESGLTPILDSLETKDATTPLSHLPLSSSASLHASLSTFSHFLSSTDTLSSPKLALLPPRFAATIHREALARISDSYKVVWEAVMDEGNKFEGRRTVMRRSREEVAMLLGVGE